MEIKILVPDDLYISAQERVFSLGYGSVPGYVFAMLLRDQAHECFTDVRDKIFNEFMSCLEEAGRGRRTGSDRE